VISRAEDARPESAAMDDEEQSVADQRNSLSD